MLKVKFRMLIINDDDDDDDDGVLSLKAGPIGYLPPRD